MLHVARKELYVARLRKYLMESNLRCSFSSSFLLRISSTSLSTSSLNGQSDGTPGSFLRLLYLPGFFRFSARA